MNRVRPVNARKPNDPPPILRQATRDDIAAIWVVRYAVTENTLTPGRISDEDVRREIEDTGRGWVIEEEGVIVAFAIGNVQSGNIWALFVTPTAQGRGYGTLLHEAMIPWLNGQAQRRLWLTTGSDTKSRAFYEGLGWKAVGATDKGEIRYELNGDDATV